MTIVSVAMLPIRRLDTPAAMPDCIAGPHERHAIYVDVKPDLVGSGQFVTLAVNNQNNDSNGSVTLNGAATADITSSGDVNFRGEFATAPTDANGVPGGNAGHLRATLRVHGQDTTQSNGFSVTAIPQNFKVTFDEPVTGWRRGFEVKESGTPTAAKPLTSMPVQDSEEIESGPDTGVFVGLILDKSGYLEPSAKFFPNDIHDVPLSFVRAPGGAATEYQTEKFRDEVTGSVDLPIANSGYIITHRVFQDPADGIWKITTTKRGTVTSVNGIASAAGRTVPDEGITLTQ